MFNNSNIIWTSIEYDYLVHYYGIHLEIENRFVYIGKDQNPLQRKKAYLDGKFHTDKMFDMLYGKKFKIIELETMRCVTEEDFIEANIREGELINKYDTQRHGCNIQNGGSSLNKQLEWTVVPSFTILAQVCKNENLKYEYDPRQLVKLLGRPLHYFHDSENIHGSYSKRRNGLFLRKRFSNSPYPETISDKTEQGLKHSKSCYIYDIYGRLIFSPNSIKEAAKILNTSSSVVLKYIDNPGNTINGFVVTRSLFNSEDIIRMITTNDFVTEKGLPNSNEIYKITKENKIISAYPSAAEAARLERMPKLQYLLKNKSFVNIGEFRLVRRKDYNFVV